MVSVGQTNGAASAQSRVPFNKTAKSFIEEKDSIRADVTKLIKNSDSADVRSVAIRSCVDHKKHREELMPELHKRGLELNYNDQLVYSRHFRPPAMQTLTFWGVRHGETPGNKQGMRQGVCDGMVNQLNDRGRSKAAELRNNHWDCDVLLCSPLKRSQDTAVPIVLGELDKGNRVKVTIDDQARDKGYFNWIAHALRQSDDIGFDDNTGEFYHLQNDNQSQGKIEVAIDYRFREMSFGVIENEPVHGVPPTERGHAMEYDQNAVVKNTEPFVEDYMVIGENGKPIIGENGRPIIDRREIPAESFGEMTLRSFNNIDYINDNYAGKKVGLVGHGIQTRSLLVTRQSDLIKVDKDDHHLMIDGAQATKVPNAEMIDLDPANKELVALMDQWSYSSQSVLQRMTVVWG